MQQCHLTQGLGWACRVSPHCCSDTLCTFVSSKYISYTEKGSNSNSYQSDASQSLCCLSTVCGLLSQHGDFCTVFAWSPSLFPLLSSASVSYPVCSLVHAVDRLNIGTSPLGISTTHPPPLGLQTEANMSVQSNIVWYQAPERRGEKNSSRLCTIQQSHCCDYYKISHGLLFAVWSHCDSQPCHNWDWLSFCSLSREGLVISGRGYPWRCWVRHMFLNITNECKQQKNLEQRGW